MAVNKACVAPAVTVISLSGVVGGAVEGGPLLPAMAWRSSGIPAIGAYWLRPAAAGLMDGVEQCPRPGNPGKPWGGPAFRRQAGITVKMVVPKAGKREGTGKERRSWRRERGGNAR